MSIKIFSNSIRKNSVQLHTAVSFKNFEDVIICVEHGDDINHYWKGRTAVTCAIYEKAYDILEYLIVKGAKINMCSQDNFMEPPLHTACRLGRIEAVKILLKAPNVDINYRDFFNRTALYASVRALLHASQLVNILLDNGADVRAATNCDECPLCQTFSLRSSSIRSSIARQLICRGCKADFPMLHSKISPLNWAVKREEQDLFILLIKSGCKVPKEDWLEKDNLPETWQKDNSFCQWIKSLQTEPKTLVHFTLCVIRDNLVKINKNIFFEHVEKLNLPKNLKDLILLND